MQCWLSINSDQPDSFSQKIATKNTKPKIHTEHISSNKTSTILMDQHHCVVCTIDGQAIACTLCNPCTLYERPVLYVFRLVRSWLYQLLHIGSIHLHSDHGCDWLINICTIWQEFSNWSTIYSLGYPFAGSCMNWLFYYHPVIKPT